MNENLFTLSGSSKVLNLAHVRHVDKSTDTLKVTWSDGVQESFPDIGNAIFARIIALSN